MVKTDVLDQNQSNQCHKCVSFTQECMESVPIFLLQYIFNVNIDEIIKKNPFTCKLRDNRPLHRKRISPSKSRPRFNQHLKDGSCDKKKLNFVARFTPPRPVNLV